MLRGTIFLQSAKYNTCSIILNRCGSSKALDIEKLEQETGLDGITTRTLEPVILQNCNTFLFQL